MASLPKGLKNYFFQSKKPPININSRFKKKYKRVKSVNVLREQHWNNRFIYDKMPDYDSYNDKNVLLRLDKKCNSSRKKHGKYLPGIPLYFNDNSLYLYRPLSNKANIIHPLINNKNIIKTFSAKTRDINDINNLSDNKIKFNQNNFLIYDDRNLKIENYKKDEILNKANINENNFSNINLINLNNIIKLWDDLFVIKNYRKLFCVIYKELDNEDKEELYQRETNELILIKNDINILKNNIELRQNTIKEIFELNKKLNTEIINKDNKSNEIIIKEISDKIEILREYTVNVCRSMKKLKLELNGLKHLDKYDINIIAEKFKFDKNYLIKMKGELNFLKEGFSKYYFNINNDQTPFLLKASEKSKIDKDTDPFVHLVPIKKELKNDMLECSYYIYQELIAYQNEKANNKFLRCISPLKRIVLENNEEIPKVINGKEEKENNINNNSNNYLNEKKSSSFVDNRIIIKDNNIENNEKIEIKNNSNKKNNYKNENKLEKKDNINKNRNDKKFKTGHMGTQKNKNNNYKNILLNYKINDRNINNQKPNINNYKKKNDYPIDKLIFKNDKTNIIFSGNNKKNEEDKKEIDNRDNF